MPLSRGRNRDRMRQFRLHKRLSSLTESKPVQPKPTIQDYYPTGQYTDSDARVELDADGNPMPEL